MNKKIYLVFVIMVTIIMVSGCSVKSNIEEITYNEYLNLIDNNETFVLYVGSETCSACKIYKPILDEFLIEQELIVKYVDLDTLSSNDYNEFLKKIAVTGTPTTIFYKEGKEMTILTRINGSVDKEEINKMFKMNNLIN